MNKTQTLYQKAKEYIPGGTQLLSKRPEQFLPGQWPAYYSKAKGCRVWDLDGKEYRDMSYMGIGSCILGYGDEDVDSAVLKAVASGNMSTLNVPEEVELAELLTEIHPWADMVRYARSGGESMSIAVRIARAHTGKDKILFCGYHGWHDWYLSANLADDDALDGHLLKGLAPKGVPRALKNTAFPFKYNDLDALKSLIKEHKGEIGAVVMEAVRNIMPDKGFLEEVRKITKENNIPYIVDEVSSGWRSFAGGAHALFNIEPDMAVFAKGMSNGYPMAAIIGKKEIMDSAQNSFISSTYWTDKIGPAAALASIKKIRDKNVPEHLDRAGKRVQDGWKEAAEKAGLKIHISGIYPLGHFEFEGEDSLILKTLFTQFMLEEGFLATNAYYASYAHKDQDIEEYLTASKRCFGKIKEAVDSGAPEKFLSGNVCSTGFQRLT